QGILTPAHSFETLNALLFKIMLAGQLCHPSGRYKTVESTIPVAQGMAFRRTLRTCQGVSNLTVPGVCGGQDRSYLWGYKLVKDVLKKYAKERLLVGSISVDDLWDMEELHILQPSVPELHIAQQQDLFERITRLDQ